MLAQALPQTAQIVMAVLTVAVGLLVGGPLWYWWTISSRRMDLACHLGRRAAEIAATAETT